MKTYQERVHEWMLKCFNEEIVFSQEERNNRFLEEALELVQSLNFTKEEAMQLVEYVYNRPKGGPVQEAGGVMVCLAALCTSEGIEMAVAGEQELERIWENIDVIRKKHAAKPNHLARK
jgi:hypothetical protein